MKLLKDFDVNGKTVLVRVDYNVPLENGKVVSDLRIRASLPTLDFLKTHGAKQIILISHLGRPKGEAKPEFSLKPVAEKLAEILNSENIHYDVEFVPELFGENVKAKIDSANASNTPKIFLLENLRFDPREEKNDAEFAKQIIESVNPELFVQDGFAVVHRAHASTDAITKLVPSCAGFLLEKEVTNLEKVTENPDHPVLVIIGGAKVEDKQPLIDKFLPVADKIFVGGKIAGDGYNPTSSDSTHKITVADDFQTDDQGVRFDIGPHSVDTLASFVYGAKTIIWNGSLGLVEQPPFDKGSRQIAETIGKEQGITSVICGGDTAGFVENLKEKEPELEFSLISTGGGASLEFLCGNKLPGIEALK